MKKHLFLGGLTVLTFLICTGCTKEVENEKMEAMILNSAVSGSYTGTCNDDKPDGDGELALEKDSMAEGTFTKGTFEKGTLTNYPYELDYNSTAYAGKFTGSLKNGKLNGSGQFVSGNESMDSYYIYDGEWTGNQPTGKGMLQTGNYLLTLSDGTVRTGKYSGEVQDGIANGTGTFSSGNESTGNYYIYEGNWDNGIPKGNGNLHTDNYLVSFKDGTNRTGVFSGSVVDGIANGTGTFTAQTDEKQTYTYEGEWKDGLYYGIGKKTFEDKSLPVLEGNFVEGEFVPTIFQSIRMNGTSEGNCTYSISANDENFINTNEALFTSHDKAGIEALVSPDFSYATYSKNPQAFSGAFAKVSSLYVAQIKEWTNSNNQDVTFLMGVSEDLSQYYCFYYFGKLPDVVTSNYIDIYFMPHNYSTYKTVSNTEQYAVVGTAVLVEKK